MIAGGPQGVDSVWSWWRACQIDIKKHQDRYLHQGAQKNRIWEENKNVIIDASALLFKQTGVSFQAAHHQEMKKSEQFDLCSKAAQTEN